MRLTFLKIICQIMKMRYHLFTLLLLMAAISAHIQAQSSNKDALKDTKNAASNDNATLKLTTQLDSVSYCLGVYLGGNLKQQGFGEVNTTIFAAGLKDYENNANLILDDKQANELLGRYVMNQRKLKANKNLDEGKLFLEKNKSAEGVIVLPSGLQYQVIKTGTGSKPALDDKVTVHYHGTLLNGKVFDSSVERGKPIQLKVSQVIDGWKEALQLMTVGSKWKLFIPANLAYGENPQPGGPIEPNSVLIFEVELISIDKDQPDAQVPANTDNSPTTK